MKKILFIPLYLSLICSPLTYSIHAPEITPFQELLSSNLKTISQRLKKLSPVKKVTLKKKNFKTLDQLFTENKTPAKKISDHAPYTENTIDFPIFFYFLLRDALFP